MVEYSSLDRYPILPLLPLFLISLAFSLALDYSFVFSCFVSFRSGNFAPIKRPLVVTAAVVVVVVVSAVVVMMMVKCTEKNL